MKYKQHRDAIIDQIDHVILDMIKINITKQTPDDVEHRINECIKSLNKISRSL